LADFLVIISLHFVVVWHLTIQLLRVLNVLEPSVTFMCMIVLVLPRLRNLSWPHMRCDVGLEVGILTAFVWLRGTVGRTSVSDRRTFAVLRSTCG